MVYRYGLLSFLYNRDTPFTTAFRLIKSSFVLLMLAAATYFLVARLIEYKKAAALPPTE